MTDQPTVEGSARRLYGTTPTDFVAARKAEAGRLREAGNPGVAKDVTALRRPSIAAALVNAVVRQDPELADEVGAVGRRLRAASGDADTGRAALRALDHDRRAIVRRCVQVAAEVAESWGATASPAALRAVEQTFWAAAVDAGALAAVRAGCLVRTLSPPGFGAVDTAGASAIAVVVDDEPQPLGDRRARHGARVAGHEPAPGGPAPDGPAPDDRALRRARDQLREAEQSLREADDEAATVAERATAADESTDRLKNELAELRRRLAAVENDLRDASNERRRTAADRQAAERRRRAASGSVERAERALRSLGDDA
ncbi:MAG: hypothetical protein ABWY58_13545 [Aeromicrobium sp.]